MSEDNQKGLMIYEAEEGEVVFDFDKEKETIWATQAEIAQIFGVDRTVVGRHLRNIFKDGELDENRVCAKNAHTAGDGKTYLVKLYNLDAIISVGYRVNSKKATKFRVWATGVLKKYVVSGVAVNERRVKELPEEKLREVEATLGLVKRLIGKTELEEGEAKGVLEVISRYGATIETIKDFEQGRIPDFLEMKTGKVRRNLTIGEVKNLAENLREEIGEGGKFGELVGEGKKMEEFLEEIGSENEEMGISERAARLLYFVVKERPFFEGNRRIGALIFIYYLTINDFRLADEEGTKMSDRALTAIVLMIAESEKNEKELMIGIVRKLLES